MDKPHLDPTPRSAGSPFESHGPQGGEATCHLFLGPNGTIGLESPELVKYLRKCNGAQSGEPLKVHGRIVIELFERGEV